MATVSLDDMRDQLLTLDQALEKLSVSEPLAELTFPVGSATTFHVQPGWADGADDDPVEAFLDTPAGARYQLTHKALLEAGAQCGIPRAYQQRLPAEFLVPQLNYWFRGGFGEREFKMLSQTRENLDHPLAMAVCRGTITPFSNLRLVELAKERIEERYGTGTEILVDYKMHHDLELTSLRLITPGNTRVITGTREENDTWCSGLDIRNSLIGLKPTDIAGYLFRWWCTNGCTDTLTSSGQFSRRGTHDEDDVWNWARDSIDAIFGQLDTSFDAIQSLTGVQVNGDVTMVLRDLFAQFGIPQRERQRVISAMADLGGDITLYDVQAAITQAGNADGLAPRAVEQLLSMGGHIAHAAHARCDSCRRLLPEGYSLPEQTQADQAATAAAIAQIATTN